MAEIINKLCTIILIVRYVTAEVNERYYPRYHLAPPHGWMNDPNGFSIYKNDYHLFYQYNPNSSLEPGIAHWGHAKSKDLFHWEHLPIAMYPDQDYDKSGVFSGSAVVDADNLILLYTGNVNHPGEDPDHEQHQALASSSDGVNFTKYSNNPVIQGEEHQPNFRDPKVWKHNDTYYMVLGNSFQNNTLGRALLYASKDLISWKQVSILDESDGSLGYMWECPDFFDLRGRYVLLFSPQGIKPQGDKYKNLYQTGYIVGDFDYKTNLFTPVTEFRELDHGHDFYATQTIVDKSHRRIMVAWFDMWEQNYPERTDGFTGFMTIPRVLSLTRDGRLIQKPVKEIGTARGKLLRSGKADRGAAVTLTDKAGEIKIKAEGNKDLEVIIEASNATVTLSYNYTDGRVSLDRGGADGLRRTKWRPRGKLRWLIYVDASSVELFCGDGEVTFSSRFFPDGPTAVRLGDESDVQEFVVNAMKRTVLKPPKGN
ncbi:sucrose-6-phosphate hydrolase-like [Pectinophora gossypiella]|uniref:sucrose-6-phosphate hydrolase-like n=1 Tax=Pectinophora gossypiella TaxID=13191 RepID=UPI00214DF7D3|nr:sucrose-6-phosphate hydrolase-like [Pectinophora gossypiella]